MNDPTSREQVDDTNYRLDAAFGQPDGTFIFPPYVAYKQDATSPFPGGVLMFDPILRMNLGFITTWN